MRKEWKFRARQSLKKHYWFFVVLLLIGGIIGTNYENATNFLTLQKNKDENTSDYVKTKITASEVLYDIVQTRNVSDMKDQAKKHFDNIKNQTNEMGAIEMAHTNGILTTIANQFATGEVLLNVYLSQLAFEESHSVIQVLYIIGSFIIVLLVTIFISKVFGVMYKRIYLEGRIYNKLPFNRLGFLFRLKRWGNVAWVLLLQTIYEILWGFTIVGIFIKKYAYFLVPYILAENPDIHAKDAISLSQEMMYGHKWECFKLQFSLVGWTILSELTFGFTGLVFSNPYKEAVYAEYYAYVRECALNHNIGNDYLFDKYLFEKADHDVLEWAYKDIYPLRYETVPTIEKRKGFWGFVSHYLGLIPYYDEHEDIYRRNKDLASSIQTAKDIVDQEIYPARLYPDGDINHTMKYIPHIHFFRHYSLISIVLIFFIMSFGGWLWEVILHIYQTGVYANRGFLHGPFLPIYGFGSVIFLSFLYRLREHPVTEFLGAVTLAGVLEYFTAFVMETVLHQKYWDYSGYYLNLHGRICMEGLLVFGIGALCIVYFIAPILDNYLSKLSAKKGCIICLVLTSIYLVDMTYSRKYPNTGEGISKTYIIEENSYERRI